MALKTRLGKLEKSQLNKDPLKAQLAKMSDEELLAELERVRARCEMVEFTTQHKGAYPGI